MKTATAAIISQDGKYLIAKRKAGGIVGGKWEFPGGKMEPNETPKQCLRRELMEEFSIDANVGNFFDDHIHYYDNGAIRVFAYLVDDFMGEFELRDHDEVRWILPSEMDNFDFIGNDWQLIKKISKSSYTGL